MLEGATSPGYLDAGDREPGAPGWFCRHCRTIHAKRGDDLRECPTPGCTRPDGFGRYAARPRPRQP